MKFLCLLYCKNHSHSCILLSGNVLFYRSVQFLLFEPVVSYHIVSYSTTLHYIIPYDTVYVQIKSCKMLTNPSVIGNQNILEKLSQQHDSSRFNFYDIMQNVYVKYAVPIFTTTIQKQKG